MKITVDREKFAAAFQLASVVAPARSPKAILRNIRMDVSGFDGACPCMLMATDLELGVRVEVGDVQCVEPGDVLLPVDRMGMILRESRDSTLAICTESAGTIRVEGERSSFKLPSANVAEYPDVAQFSGDKYHKLPARVLAELIRRTAFACDTDSSRYALGGVLLELIDSEAVAVATDGRRLAAMNCRAESVNEHSTDGKAVVVPQRAMKLIERTLADCEGDVQIVASNNDVLLRTPSVTVFSRLVEGRFPKWRDVFPRRSDSVKIELTAGPFHSAVRQAAIVTSDESKGVDFTFGAGKATLAAVAAERGQSRVELPIAYDGPAITITLDPHYVGDFLKVLEPERVFTLDVKDENGAAVCSTDDGYRYVIMPLARDKRA